MIAGALALGILAGLAGFAGTLFAGAGLLMALLAYPAVGTAVVVLVLLPTALRKETPPAPEPVPATPA